jgi:hypothetical protein
MQQDQRGLSRKRDGCQSECHPLPLKPKRQIDSDQEREWNQQKQRKHNILPVTLDNHSTQNITHNAPTNAQMT